MRSLEALVNTADPAWPIVLELIDKGTNHVEVLPGDRARCNQTLVRLQVTTRSPMGAIAHQSGGLLIDHGWIRLLGGGHDRLPRDLASWNYGPWEAPEERLPGALLIGDDVIGGFYAIHGGALPGQRGNVHYFAPDSLEWEDLGRGYTDFLSFLTAGDLDKFYEGFRWPGWREDIVSITPAQALSILPPLWAKGPPVTQRSRRPVPIDEMWAFQQDVRRQLLDGGTA